MFVTRGKYDTMYRRALTNKAMYEETLRRYNDLVTKINAKGGEEFLELGEIAPPAQFAKHEIKTLISLCHPDKHSNSRSATEITQRLLSLK